MATRSMAFVALIPLALLACAAREPEVASVGSQTPDVVPPGLIKGPFVQAGTLLSVKLDQAMDSYYTPPGTPFTATVTEPLRGTDARVLVPIGAKVHGTLASVGKPDVPVVRVEFDRIDTVAGTLPLHAAVRDAQHYDWKGPPVFDSNASYIFPYGATDYGSGTLPYGAEGQGEAEGRTMMQPREVRVPTDSVMVLVLIEPLIMPGAELTKTTQIPR